MECLITVNDLHAVCRTAIAYSGMNDQTTVLIGRTGLEHAWLDAPLHIFRLRLAYQDKDVRDGV
jgi:hypothetical protein